MSFLPLSSRPGGTQFVSHRHLYNVALLVWDERPPVLIKFSKYTAITYALFCFVLFLSRYNT